MRSFAILVCVLSVAVTTLAIDVDQISKMLEVPKNDLEQCLTDNRLTNDDIEKAETIFQDNLSPDEIEKYMKNFSCFISCTFEKANIMKHGEINLDEVMKVVERNKIALNTHSTKRLQNCAAIAETMNDKCEAALTFSLCFMQHIRHR